MSYKNAIDILPQELIAEIQKYICGESIYIPTKQEEHKVWGEKTGYREELEQRNQDIFSHYLDGTSVPQLAEQFFLSQQSIYRIIGQIQSKE